ncbi:K1324 protein, partial [Nyctibius bracteatus]|nr:K1324 protein [Nyctibius bracteatus]
PDPVPLVAAFSCRAGEFLDMRTQACRPCAHGTYSLGTGVRFDEWDEVPRGFANVAADLEVDDGFGDAVENCTGSTWVPLGDYVASNTDECTATLMYAVSLKQSGTVSFEYIYPDSSIVFEFFHPPRCPGVAYTSECFPCKPGTYAPAAGSSACHLCPADTFSGKGATACQPCEPATYAEPGSASCKPRPPCTDKDYFYTHTACDASGETQLMFKWAEPKICSEELPGATLLPPSGVKSRCPPCNPGFAAANGTACQPCPHGSYSNGSGCHSCPPGTEPALGLEYKWWNVLPPNMETTVLSGINFEYKGMAGWEVAGDYIYTAAGASDNDFMILTLVVPGFSPPSPVLEDAESKEVARITFLYSINVTNVLGGVASFCRRCVPQPAGSCAPCPPGSAVERGSGTCHPCPPGTYLRGHPSDGTPACHPCGPGTRSNQLRSLCYNNCTFSLALRGRILRYEFPALAAGAALASGPSFTAKGRKYFHHFSLSLCGHQGRKAASCTDNMTDARLPAGGAGPARVVTAYVCQAIVVPPDVVGYKTPVSSQPVSLADRLVGVTTSSTLDGIISPPEHFPPGHPNLPDIIFFYR